MEKRSPDWKDPWDPVFLEAIRQAQAAAAPDAVEADAAAPGEAAAETPPRDAGRAGVGQRLVAELKRRQSVQAAGESLASTGSRPEEAKALRDAASTVFNVAPQHMVTTIYDGQPSGPTWHQEEESDDRPLEPLIAAYHRILERMRLQDQDDAPLLALIGQGGQGVVYRTECRGSDGFAYPAAVKVFSPERYPSVRSYEKAMRRSARVASWVAATYHGNVVGIQGFRQHQGIRLMFMDLVDGCDLRRLSNPKLYDLVRRNSLWADWSKVVVADGPERARFLPGVAVAIIRDCLAGLSSLHRLGLVHGDVKPANIMLKRSIGRAELVDLGSAFELCDPPSAIIQTPAYAAPEAMNNGMPTTRSDLASLGYVLVELLAGRQIFRHDMTSTALMSAKRTLPQRLRSLVPEKEAGSSKLIRFCEKLIAFHPEDRFADADEADTDNGCGASAFHNELVQAGLSAVYDCDIRHWLDAVACGT